MKLSISPRVWPKIAHFSPKFCSSRNSKSGCEIDGTSERPQQTPDSLEPASCKLSLQNITSTCGLITNPSRHPSTVRNRPYYRLCSHGGFSGSCNSASKLAVQRRYNMTVFLCVLSGSLQGIAVRPLPCHYNRFQFFSALSRRYHGFKSRRGRQIFSATYCHLPVLGWGHFGDTSVPQGRPPAYADKRQPCFGPCALPWLRPGRRRPT